MTADASTRPRDVRIVEVFCRDGLQTLVHEEGLHSPTTDEKVAIIGRMAAAGIPEIEATGFVHPRVVPVLADAAEVMRRLPVDDGVVYRALVPNVRGAERAIAAGCRKLSALIVCSDTYNMKNVGMTVAQNVEQVGLIADLARQAGVDLDVSMGMCFLCPYEGAIPEERILDLIDTFVSWGIHDISIADSIGMAGPRLIGDRVAAILRRWPDLLLGVHLHDRTGMAMAGIVAAYENGARSFESCIGGYGGGIAMPVSVLGMGNVPTEDVVHLFREMGIETGVDLAAVRAVGTDIAELIGLPTRSRVARYGTFEEFHALSLSHRDDRGSLA